MTPADILAAARTKPLSPVVPARGEWLKDWTGPSLWLDTFRNPEGVWIPGAYGPGGMAYGQPAERIRLDPRRPEIRDRLCRMGAPEWCRESVAGLLAWVLLGSALNDVLSEWAVEDDGRPRRRNLGVEPVQWRIGITLNPGGAFPAWVMWENTSVPVTMLAGGPETGPEGRACADLAALSAGCVLTESDGWYIPLPGGNVGWLPKEAP